MSARCFIQSIAHSLEHTLTELDRQGGLDPFTRANVRALFQPHIEEAFASAKALYESNQRTVRRCIAKKEAARGH